MKPCFTGVGLSKFSFSLLVIIVSWAFVVNCGKVSPPQWPWWTSEDSSSVRRELEKWQDYLSVARAWKDTFWLDFNAGLNYSDSSSRSGDTLYKIAHLIRIWVEPGMDFRKDIYQFGVTVDTVVMSDTFCQVIFRDSFSSGIMHIEFDTLWIIGFRPDTIIDTTKTPPETTVVYKVSSVEKRDFPVTHCETKEFNWISNRWLYLRRLASGDTFSYTARKISGGYAFIPSSEEAPQISRVVLRKPGRVDTIYFAPRSDGKGLTNLKPMDSLYSIHPNEEVTVSIYTTTPQDTVVDRNRFFVTVRGYTTDVTAGPKIGQGTVRFSSMDTGYQHIFIEVLPTSNLLYPHATFTATIWAIPIRIVSE